MQGLEEPQIQPWNPSSDKTEKDWIYTSGMRAGFALALSRLGLKED